MSVCQSGHVVRIRYERCRWRFWHWYPVIFCACCDLEVREP